MTDPLLPSDFGIDHSEWRPFQQQAVEWAVATDGPLIIEAPTGSGKTAIAKALVHDNRGVALVRTKVLQQNNYERGYDFIPLYGKNNYQCVHEDADVDDTADDCRHAEEGMNKCQMYARCPYVRARDAAKASPKTVLNYAYWLNVVGKWPEPGILVCDEAHQLSDLTLDWAGITITEEERVKWELGMFPILRSGSSSSIFAKAAPVEDRAMKWLEESRLLLMKQFNFYSARAETDNKAMKKARQIERLGKKIRATMDAMSLSQNDWYIVSGPGARIERGVSKRAFIAKPLTARHHFPSYFVKDWKLALMSATIGNPDIFAAELGIKQFEHYVIPSAWSPQTRPVFALDVPRLGQKAPDTAWAKQADEIAKAIKTCDPRWSGIVHVTSIAESARLAQRLSQRGLQNRIYVPPTGQGTNALVDGWQTRKLKVPGSIMIAWSLWEGYDGVEEKINIAAKVPYPFMGDDYEVQRRNHDGKYYLQRTAWQLEQGLGRTRRGNPEDYDTDGQRRGMVAIADGSYKQVRNYFSPTFLESLMTL